MPFLSGEDCLMLLQDLQAYACLLQPGVAHTHKILPDSVAGLRWRSVRSAGLSVCICAGLLAGGTGVTAVASLASTILNNPEDDAKVRFGQCSRWMALLMP